MSRPPDRSDRGETLIESIISVLILSIAVVAVVGAIGAGTILSGGHRDDADADLDLKSAVEVIKELTYIPRAAEGTYAASTGISLAAGEYQKARCWPGTSATLSAPTAWPYCASTGLDGGLQLIELAMVSEGRVETTTFMMRQKPSP